MSTKRRSGILLHPTSLPSAYGIGDLGSSSYAFIDFLKESGQSIWQMLPLGPTGYSNSPYQALSAFAGNPALISPELLIEDRLLDTTETYIATDDLSIVDFDRVIPCKLELLQKAYESFKLQPHHHLREEFHTFCSKESYWLDDFALFLALKSYYENTLWTEWPADIRSRQPKALEEYREKLDDRIESYCFIQFLFFHQYDKLHLYAQKQGIELIGDIPIFVAQDSSDVWSHPEWFLLDKDGNPTVVAGVPPDYFSQTGQRWGNPIYDWKQLKKEGYSFWIDRFRHTFAMFDCVRIDHFRGFVDYWEIPASQETAIDGEWRRGPGLDLFKTIMHEFGGLIPVIAEDLGIITDDVIELRDMLDFPGMAVLQFGFESMQSSDPSSFLPHNLKVNQVVYTGTHDNNTTIGWWSEQPEEVDDFLRCYLNTDAKLINMDMIRAALRTTCHMAIFPMQDLLGLGSDSKMNMPGTTYGNWQWRMLPDAINSSIEKNLLRMTKLYGR
ncbi:MAG: 4-alpha-glucanotransferase [Campylobacterota bacterium]|nr:4-alpha-glucanotransferase [Campylobacterota bacterium]